MILRIKPWTRWETDIEIRDLWEKFVTMHPEAKDSTYRYGLSVTIRR